MPTATGSRARDSVAVSADGKNVYVTSANAVVRFDRKQKSGVITEPAGSAGCVSEDGSGPCTDGRGLSNAYVGAVSGDGKSVYVASLASDAVARFNRAP